MMNSNNYLLQKVYEAYRKLKNYCYYDNSSLFTKKKLAEYEIDFFGLDRKAFKKAFKDKTKDLLEILNGCDKDNQKLNSLLSNIDFTILPKSLKRNVGKQEENISFISNQTSNSKYEIDEYNVFIDAPIEIHLICTLWVLLVGKHLSHLSKAYNYAYNLSQSPIDSEGKDDLSSGLQLYTPYYKGYQKWRDNALSKAESILENHKNATIVSLDIKRYFYNVRMNVNEFVNNLISQNNIRFADKDNSFLCTRLTKILNRIHMAYATTIRELYPDGINSQKEEALLPLGLVSSGLLGNLYLTNFDNLVIDNLHPEYYGRYVDDMLFVIQGADINDCSEDFLYSYFVENRVLEEKDDNYIIAGDTYNGRLAIQKKKIMIEHFVHYDSKAALMKFKRNIQRQRSEFRFLPDEDIIEKDFDEAAFSMQYSGSINKLKNIVDYREDKYGASTYLAHKIFLACYNTTDCEEEKQTSKQILSFFRGYTALDFYSLWEKVFTYFIINKDVQAFYKFQKQLFSTIERCKYEDNSIVSSRIQKAMREILSLSIALPLSMNLGFISPSNLFEEETVKCAKYLRQANLFRHQYMAISGLNLTTCLTDNSFNLFSYDFKKRECQLNTDNANMLLLPQHIHYDVICYILILHYANLYKNPKKNNINDIFINIPKESFEKYKIINYKWQNLYAVNSSEQQKSFINDYSLIQYEKRRIHYFTIKDLHNTKYSSVNKRIAIANLRVDKQIIEQTALGSVNLSYSRRKDLFCIINESIRNKCNVLVLPELSVPYQWLDLLVSVSKKHNIAIIAGLTYFVSSSNYALNIVATILPVKMNYYNTCVIIPRVKNHYAPDEKKLLKSYAFKIPMVPNSDRIYHLFHWRKTYFSVYNCFELASIEDRSLLKSKVDFIVATELNSDTNYYSDIAGSWVRDIHSYFIQVNTAEFGDSRIMKPAKTVEKNIVTVKGGRNATALVDDIDIDALRKFQLPGYAAQTDFGTFKLTPPEFNHNDVKTRIKNKDFK